MTGAGRKGTLVAHLGTRFTSKNRYTLVAPPLGGGGGGELPLGGGGGGDGLGLLFPLLACPPLLVFWSAVTPGDEHPVGESLPSFKILMSAQFQNAWQGTMGAARDARSIYLTPYKNICGMIQGTVRVTDRGQGAEDTRPIYLTPYNWYWA